MPNHAAGAVRQGTRFVCLSIVPQFGEECKRKLRLLPSGPQKLQCVCFKPGNVTPAYLEQLCRFQLSLYRRLIGTDFLRQLAFVDGLTGIANRRRFDDALQSAWRHGLRTQGR